MFTLTHFLWLAVAVVIVATTLFLNKKFHFSLKTNLNIMTVALLLSETVKTLSAISYVEAADGYYLTPEWWIKMETESRNFRPCRVLFLGNSLMYYNDMPGLFASLCEAAGKNVSADSVTKGSATMAQFADRSTEIGAAAFEKLTTEKWDYVIVEPSRRISPEEDTVMRAETDAARVLKALANAAGAELLFYAVFGNNNGRRSIFRMTDGCASEAIESLPASREEHTAIMREANQKIAADIGGVRLIPTGKAFEAALAQNRDLDLYHTDRRHPNPAGSFLAACTVYCVLFGEKTVGIPFDGGIPSAPFLQQMADQTVFST